MTMTSEKEDNDYSSMFYVLLYTPLLSRLSPFLAQACSRSLSASLFLLLTLVYPYHFANRYFPEETCKPIAAEVFVSCTALQIMEGNAINLNIVSSPSVSLQMLMRK